MAYESPHTFRPDPIDAAAVFCSDGRVGDHFDDFLTAGLGLRLYDRLCLPGGPACLAGPSGPATEAVLEEMCFLVEAHELDRVILIAHQGCAFYAQRMEVAGEISDAQVADLHTAAEVVRKATGVATVETWFLRLDGSQVSFQQVE